MNKRVASIICMSLVASMSLAGCKKGADKIDYEALYNQKIVEADSLKGQIKTVKKLLYTYDPTLADVQDLTDYVILPTGKTAYVQLNDTISMNSKLNMGQSVVVPNQTKVGVTDSVFFSPSENWTFSLGTGAVKMSHINGIYGALEVYSYNGDSNAYSAYEDIIKKHLEAIKAEELNKKTLFLGEKSGTMVESRLYVVERTDKETGEVTKEVIEEVIESSVAAESSVAEGSEAAETTVAETTVAETTVAETTVAETTQEIVYQTNEAGETAVDESGVPLTIAVEPETEPELSYTEEIIPYRYVCGVVIGNYSEIPDALVFQYFYPESSNIVSSTEVITTMIKSIIMGSNYITLE